MKNVDLRTLTPEARAELKRVALRLHNSGKTKSAIGRERGIRRATISGGLVRYDRTGTANHQEHKRGRPKGNGRSLTPAQEECIRKDITEQTPDPLKLSFALWSGEAVQQWIDRCFRIDMPIRTVRTYLARWGFTPQRPVNKAYEQQPKAVKKWLDESYRQIKARAQQEEAEIHWADEAGVSSQDHYPRGSAPKGKTPVFVRSHSQRERVNMISSITNQGKLRFMLYEGKFRSQTFIRFLGQRIKGASKKSFVVLDNLRVHHSQAVKKWVEGKEEQIELFFLPSDSPELNPDEYLNGDLKASLKRDKPTRKKGDMKIKMRRHLKSIQAQPNRIRSYFKHEKIAYAA